MKKEVLLTKKEVQPVKRYLRLLKEKALFAKKRRRKNDERKSVYYWIFHCRHFMRPQ